MNTKMYVLGAVLGTAPALMPLVCTPWTPSAQKREEEPRDGASRNGARVAPPPPVPAAHEPGVPVHPCELITVTRVPCDASTQTCEYTYWQCPQSAGPLRA